MQHQSRSSGLMQHRTILELDRERMARVRSSGSVASRPHKERRHFAQHSHDQQVLEQMVHVLAHSETTDGQGAGERIASHSAVQQAQMYAMCMQELVLQIGDVSPKLAELCGTLWHGFVGLFKRALGGEETRHMKEAKAHAVSRVELKAAEGDAEHWEKQCQEWRARALELQQELDEKGRDLLKTGKQLFHEQEEAGRLRNLLESRIMIGRGERAANSAAEEMAAGLEEMDELAAEAHAQATSAGKVADNLRMMVRCVGQVQTNVSFEDAEVQTDLDGVDLEAAGVGAGAGGHGGGRQPRRRATQFETAGGGAAPAQGEEAGGGGGGGAASGGGGGGGTSKPRRRPTSPTSPVGRRPTSPTSAVGRRPTSPPEATGGPGHAPTTVGVAPVLGRVRPRGGHTHPLQRLATRKGSKAKAAQALPRRMTDRLCFQYLTEAAHLPAPVRLDDVVYEHWLTIYGMKRLAERYLLGFIAGIRAHAPLSTRCALFGALLGVSSAVRMTREEAELVCAAYGRLQREAFDKEPHHAGVRHGGEGAAHPRTDHAATAAARGGAAHDDYGELVECSETGQVRCSAAAAGRTVRSIFARLSESRPDAYARVAKAAEALQVADGKGRPSVDVDELVRALLEAWRAERVAMRDEAAALFTAGDVNGDGELSLDEFGAILALLSPEGAGAKLDEARVMAAFRACLARAAADEEAGGGAGAQPVEGISSAVFVAVMEEQGLIGVKLEAAAGAGAGAGGGAGPTSGASAGGGGPHSGLSTAATAPPSLLPSAASAASSSPTASPARGRGKGRKGAQVAVDPAAKEAAVRQKRKSAVSLSLLELTWEHNGAKIQEGLAELLVGLSELAPPSPPPTAGARKGGRRATGDGGADSAESLRLECETLSVRLAQIKQDLQQTSDPEAGWKAFRAVAQKFERLETRFWVLKTSTPPQPVPEDVADAPAPAALALQKSSEELDAEEHRRKVKRDFLW